MANPTLLLMPDYTHLPVGGQVHLLAQMGDYPGMYIGIKDLATGYVWEGGPWGLFGVTTTKTTAGTYQFAPVAINPSTGAIAAQGPSISITFDTQPNGVDVGYQDAAYNGGSAYACMTIGGMNASTASSQTVTLWAASMGFSNPVYQYGYMTPSGTWTFYPQGSYTSAEAYTFPTFTQPGIYAVDLYVEDASQPYCGSPGCRAKAGTYYVAVGQSPPGLGISVTDPVKYGSDIVISLPSGYYWQIWWNNVGGNHNMWESSGNYQAITSYAVHADLPGCYEFNVFRSTSPDGSNAVSTVFYVNVNN